MSAKGQTLSLQATIQEYLEYLTVERQVSPYTVRNYRFYLNYFDRWLDKHYPGTKVTELNPRLLKSYRLYLARVKNEKGEQLSPVTQSYYVIAVRSYLRYLLRNDYEVVSPDRLELPKGKEHSLKFLDFEHIEQMMAVVDTSTVRGMRDRAIMEVLFSTGLRVSELVSLDKSRVNLKTREFGVLGKGGRVRLVFLSERAASSIEQYLRARDDFYEPLFVRHSGSAPDIADPKASSKLRLTTRTVQRIIARYGRLAHLPFAMTPHVMRHSFASDLLSHGAGLREVQEMLGHKNIATTQIYTHVTNPQLHSVHERYHSGGKGE